VVRRDDFVRRLDGMVFGMNPREGFFEGETFLHPDMRFRFDFPSGWQTVNQKSAVQGLSQNKDALIGITLAQGSPGQALNQFASQQGVQVGAGRQTTINGLPATTAEFVAATEQGNLHGLIAFVEHANTTFQLMGYTPESRWGSYQSTISRSLGSFARLTDQRALAVQPKRIDVIQLPSAMSFSTFNQRYPSVEKPELVALINQVEGDARLSSGALYKRIVDGR
jgi:predicted Zn-dependent protease